MGGFMPSTLDTITIKGACEHNLRDVYLEIPKRTLTVFCGVSGSGKSSLAFDTIYAEGQRRYVESLSAYARQFLGQMEKPRYDWIRGLSPTISIEQKAASKNPRSTVGTITEIYDYFRLLWARVGEQRCYQCGGPVEVGTPDTIVRELLSNEERRRFLLLAPIIENRKGEHKEVFEAARGQGFVRVRVDGVVRDLSEPIPLKKTFKHYIEVVVDRLAVRAESRARIQDSVEAALHVGKGRVIVAWEDGDEKAFSDRRICVPCGISFPELEPQLFSFNSPLGMCPDCNGIGTRLEIDPVKLVPDENLTIREGAVIPWKNRFDLGTTTWGARFTKILCEHFDIALDRPFGKLAKRKRDLIFHGSGGEEIEVPLKEGKFKGSYRTAYEGLIPGIQRRFRDTTSSRARAHYQKFMTNLPCPTCAGRRLRPESISVLVDGHGISEVSALSVVDAVGFFTNIRLEGSHAVIGEEILKEIRNRLRFLNDVGLSYLTLDRSGPTLSGGEAQRIRLASQVGSELTGVLYVLDEPSIGLHQRDNRRLLATLEHLRDIGNTLVVVEHDEETIARADHVVEFGPGAGKKGGEVVFTGTPKQLNRAGTLTGKYLSGRKKIEIPAERRRGNGKMLRIRGARANNLKDIDVAFPLGVLTCITGVSGAGKSSLIEQTLYPAVARQLHSSQQDSGDHDRVEGLSHIDKVIDIDQSPIGRTPRSNPATYTKVFDEIRKLFAELPEARARGYKPGRFSFNVKGGRCEACQGAGSVLVQMHFLADVYVPCSVCRGNRYNENTLTVFYRGKSIRDVLDMTIAEARELFANHPKIRKILDTLIDVGLSYISLGQSATTFSGGEAQRTKLSRELAKRDTGRTLYILDEPTTGLHFEDIRKLLGVLNRLVEKGNTVLVIEHNLDVIKTADWIVDLGPEGGDGGGEVVATGTPEEVAANARSFTGSFLSDILIRNGTT
ncbi:MAG: excinuclease ABC subunit UvrA [Planctomycetota bacterium]